MRSRSDDQGGGQPAATSLFNKRLETRALNRVRVSLPIRFTYKSTAANDNRTPPLIVVKRTILIALSVGALAWLMGVRPH